MNEKSRDLNLLREAHARKKSEEFSSRYITASEQLTPTGFEPDHGNPYFKDTHGRKLYLLTQHPAQQLFASMLMSTVIPRCDVVYEEKTGQFYSYGVDETKDLGVESEPDYEADAYILAVVFGVYDRSIDGKNTVQSDGDVYHYDFPATFGFTHRNVDNDMRTFTWMPESSRPIARQKLLKLRQLYSGPAGIKYLSAAHKRAKSCGQQSELLKQNSYYVAPVELGAPTKKYGAELGRVNYSVSFGGYNIDTVEEFQKAMIRRLDELIRQGDEWAKLPSRFESYRRKKEKRN